MGHFWATAAVVTRNVRIAFRRPDLLLQAMAVPVVVLGLASVLFGATDAWPTAVVDQSHTTESAHLLRAMTQTRGARGAYFRVYTTDPTRAAQLVQQGRLQLVVTIPADFAVTHVLRTRTYNINTDAMKNIRLRLATMANREDESDGIPGVTAQIDKARPVDVTRSGYMGGSAIILALLLGAALISANLYAIDDEHRTGKEMALSPLGAQHAASGAAAAGALLSLAAAFPTLIVALLLGLRAAPADAAQAVLIVLPAALVAAGLGVLTAVGLRTHRLIQPVIILLALGSYFASGGFIPVPGLPPLARHIAQLWPVSYIFGWTNPVLHGFQPGPPTGAVAGTITAGAVVLAAAMVAARADRGRRPAQGQ